MGAIEKSCCLCGQAFTCGRYGCWCNTVPVTDAQYDWILEHFPDCLCPECLERVSTGAIGPPVKRPIM